MTLLAGLLDTIRGVRVDEPLWLAAMASLGFLLGLLAARWMTAMAPVRRRSALLARTILFALLGALLGGATSLRTSDQVATVVVLDVSGSVRRFYTPPASSTTIDPTRALADTVTRAVDRLSVGRRPDDLLGVVYADSRPQPVRAPSIAPIGDLPTPVAGDEGTDLESALRLAAAMVPPGAAGRILLISDGNQTVGDALAAAEELGGSARPSAGESGGVGGLAAPSIAPSPRSHRSTPAAVASRSTSSRSTTPLIARVSSSPSTPRPSRPPAPPSPSASSSNPPRLPPACCASPATTSPSTPTPPPPALPAESPSQPGATSRPSPSNSSTAARTASTPSGSPTRPTPPARPTASAPTTPAPPSPSRPALVAHSWSAPPSPAPPATASSPARSRRPASRPRPSPPKPSSPTCSGSRPSTSSSSRTSPLTPSPSRFRNPLSPSSPNSAAGW